MNQHDFRDFNAASDPKFYGVAIALVCLVVLLGWAWR
jgi:hypothetical protein